LLGVSMWIRLRLHESPLFKKMIDEGRGAKKPLTEAFGKWSNLKIVLVALFGVTAGQAVIGYTGQFYTLFYLEKVLKVDGALTNTLVALSLIIGMPFFVVFGWLSDRIGRKWIIVAGCALAVVGYFPIFKALTQAANPALAQAAAVSPVTVIADPDDCSFQFDPIGKTVFSTSCDLIKSHLAKAGVPYANKAAPKGTVAAVSIGSAVVQSFRGDLMPKAQFIAARAQWEKGLAAALTAAGYPAKADSAKVNKPLVVALLALLVINVTMVYGPIAALLVEMFPTRIRYTSMSLPYHVGNGWFGGFLPTTAFAMVAATGDIYYGLWYPVVVSAASVVIASLFLRETKTVDISA